MGKFIYENSVKVDFDDRLLLHLQTVIGTKLRRSEPFHFSWKEDVSTGSGRTTVWVHPQSNLVYRFYGSRTAEINRAWLEALMYTANAPTGLYAVPEPPPQAAGDSIGEESAAS